MNVERLEMSACMNEGLDDLIAKKLRYLLARHGDEGISGMIKLPKHVIGQLRECGFRVGCEMVEGENVVFFKGRFFGVTAG